MCHTLAVKITTKLKDESMAKSRKKTTTVAKIEAKETQHSRFLLLDSRLIASTSNAVLKLGCVKKHDENPLFTEEKPWEQRFDNLYGNVYFDTEQDLYKCWYSPFIVAHSAKGISSEKRLKEPFTGHKNQEMGICYATSKDGITWHKPTLDLVEYDGSCANNIVWRGPHGAGIFKDPREPDDNRRYKTIFRGLNVGFSKDGVNWSKAVKLQGIEPPGDTHNFALWAPTLNKFVGFTRTWRRSDKPLIGQESKTNHNWIRQVARIESHDFTHWSAAEPVLEGKSQELQTYSMPVFYHAGIYLGLLVIHDQKSDRAWTELAWSPDTTEWQRIEPGKAFIGCSETELDYDFGCVYACANPVFLEGEIRLYYGGSDWLHFGWREGCLALATLRPDGFAGFEQATPGEPANVTTTTFLYSGENIAISADIAPGGSLEFKLLSAKDNVLASAELNRTTTDERIFQEHNIAHGDVYFEFTLKSAKLYSFVLE